MRDLVLRGAPWSAEEPAAIVDYCESGVLALARLLPAMELRLDLPHALVRGRYMAAAATMEHAGIPIDMPTLALLRQHWTDIQDQLIAAIDVDYHVYEGRTFKLERFEAWLARCSGERCVKERLDARPVRSKEPATAARVMAEVEKKPREAAVAKPRRRRQPAERYIQATEAGARGFALGGNAVLVWFEILYRVWKTKQTTIELPNGSLADMGVSQWTKYRALDRLERAGWIRAERLSGRTVRVALLKPGCLVGVRDPHR